jgi:hypothetical protein
MVAKMRQSEEPQKSQFWTAKVVAGVLLAIPWEIIYLMFGKTSPALVYSVGLFIGILTGYAVWPHPAAFLAVFLVGVATVMVHGMLFPPC